MAFLGGANNDIVSADSNRALIIITATFFITSHRNFICSLFDIGNAKLLITDIWVFKDDGF